MEPSHEILPASAHGQVERMQLFEVYRVVTLAFFYICVSVQVLHYPYLARIKCGFSLFSGLRRPSKVPRFFNGHGKQCMGTSS